MRNWITAFALAVLPLTAAAQDTGLKSLDTTDAGRQWMAVGRLDIEGTGFCTGTLISPTLVLTAAHCLFDKVTLKRVDPAKIQFLAGWRLGRASAYRTARQAVVHPEYVFGRDSSVAGVRNDIALVELQQPIRNTSVIPFETGDRPARGEEVGVVSYAQDRSEAPSLQEVCSIMSRYVDVLVMSCDVDLGASGSPVFSFAGEIPRIVSVVSAKAEISGESVALGTPVKKALEVLRNELSSKGGSKAPLVSIGTSNDTGVRFVRP